MLSRARTFMVQLSHQRFDESKSFLPFRYLENSVIADDYTGGPNICLTSNDFGAAQKVMIGVTSPIWVPVGLAVLVGSVPVIGAVSLTKKVANMIDSRKYEKDKLGFIVQASREYLCNVAKEQQLWLFVEEQLKDVRVYLTQVSSRLREFIDADRMLCQQLRDEIRSGKEIKEFYGPLEEMSVRVKEKIALFFIREVQSLEISHNDLKWFEDDQSSLLGNGASASVYRGTFRIPGQREPTQVAVKLWNKELNESTAIGFLSKTEILQKLDFHFIVKFFGTALLKKGDRYRVIHVMEICDENLMSRIFQNPENIPGMSVKTTAEKNVLCWAKDIAEAIEFIHSQGIVHRGLKLVKIL
ncbi:Inhibitor of nuclear factor kappa-B kinase subunit epsilon, partial [Stylophora pistillata]